ncbi:MAG: hypothetical protein FJ368_05910 [Pelagibacterales bacterium]|nr:hypothetical protein [Pelagibacterales bacterium]
MSNRAYPVSGQSIGSLIFCFQAGTYPRLGCGFFTDTYAAVNQSTPNTAAGLNYDEKFLLRFTATSAKSGMRVSTKRLPNLRNATVAAPAGSTTNTSFPFTPCLGNNSDIWLGAAFAGGIYELAVFNRELSANEDYTVTNYFKRKHDL